MYEESPMNSEVLLLPKIDKEELLDEGAVKRNEEEKKMNESVKSKNFNIKEWVADVKRRMEV